MAAALHLVKSTLSPISVSHSNFPGKSSREMQYSGKKFFKLQCLSGNSRRLHTSSRRLGVRCAAQETENQSNGEEPPESLFMKELKRRGMTPTSLLEDTKMSDSVGFVDGEKREEGRGFLRRNAVSTGVDKSLTNQRETSMLLNSEGLEGLIPRAKLLLTIGGTFFLAFWPLILLTFTIFFALYFYFGPSFVHDATNRMPISPPQYVDPYALLEEDRISQIATRVN